MDESQRQQTEGRVDEATGKAKEGLGRLRNDEDQVAEGRADQAQGQAKQGFGKVMDKVNEAIKRFRR